MGLTHVSMEKVGSSKNVSLKKKKNPNRNTPKVNFGKYLFF